MDDFNPKDYWENRLQSKFGLEGVGYAGLGYHYNKWLYKVRRNIFNRKVSNLATNPDNISVLDIGCGNGFYIERWEEFGAKNISGVDITEISVKNLSHKYPQYDFYRADIGSDHLGPVAQQRFNLISAFDILFHIVEDQRYEMAISNIYDLLKPEGIFLWSDNFLQNNTQKAVHQISRSLEYIENVVISTGFQIVERCPMFYLMNAPVDSTNRCHQFLWRLISYVAPKKESMGWLTGFLLYPFELAITSILKEGPTTELMICRKT